MNFIVVQIGCSLPKFALHAEFVTDSGFEIGEIYKVDSVIH